MLNFLAHLINIFARKGAGNASALASYQPKTPACLLEDEE